MISGGKGLNANRRRSNHLRSRHVNNQRPSGCFGEWWWLVRLYFSVTLGAAKTIAKTKRWLACPWSDRMMFVLLPVHLNKVRPDVVSRKCFQFAFHLFHFSFSARFDFGRLVSFCAHCKAAKNKKSFQRVWADRIGPADQNFSNTWQCTFDLEKKIGKQMNRLDEPNVEQKGVQWPFGMRMLTDTTHRNRDVWALGFRPVSGIQDSSMNEPNQNKRKTGQRLFYVWFRVCNTKQCSFSCPT